MKTKHLSEASANPKVPLAERFWGKVPLKPPQPDECWEWHGAIMVNGYGVFSIRRSYDMLAHRVSLELASDPIPDGMQIDHACRNRRCVRLGHLSLVEPAYNSRQCGPVMRAKTHCRKGHEYAKTGVYKGHKGRRRCRACTRANWSKHHP